MVKLIFNAHGYAFQDGIRLLRVTYEAAETAFSDEIGRAKGDAFGHQQSLEQGAMWEGEKDDDGHVLWDQQTILDDKVVDAEAAAQEFRKAFAITIYHYWERAAQRWVGSSEGNHTKLIFKVKALGYAIDPRMEDMLSLANLLKHDKIKAAESLLEKWSDLFFDLDWAQTGGSNAVHLMPHHIESLLEIAAASGPKTDTIVVKTDIG